MKSLREWLKEDDYTLALSSAFFGFYAHCGIATALYEENLVPRKFTGASAGALVAGGLASGIDPQSIKELIFSLQRSDFWDPKLGAGYLHGKKFREILKKHFSPSFEKATSPLAVAVFDVLSMRTRFLQSGPLPEAVVASCAVPLLFHPVRIGSRIYMDGGVFHKSGIELENKNERTLCAFIQSAGMVGLYETKSGLKNLTAQQSVLHFQNLPSVRPHSLSEGKKAYAEAYHRTKLALDLPYNRIVNA